MGATAIALLLPALMGCRGDRFESFYPTFADADRDGAITRGWIPPFLPRNSSSIREIHDLSPSEEWCAFDFTPSDSYLQSKLTREIRTLPPSLRRVQSPGVSWWPSVLTGDLNLAKIHSEGFALYIVVAPETERTSTSMLVAVDWQKGLGFFFAIRVTG